MKLSTYLKDKLYAFLIFIIYIIILILFLIALKLSSSIIIFIIVFTIVIFFVILFFDYFRKRKFYSELLDKLNTLDKKYLLIEMLLEPNFLEGKILYDVLDEVNKNEHDLISNLKNKQEDFKEYIELWIHEVKLPLASLTLINRKDKNTLRELKRIEDDVEQILYYVRCENANNDYLIKEWNLDTIIKNVALRNKDDLLALGIDFKVDNCNLKVLTDSKWLEFIINQIVSNSIKYKKDKDSIIEITGKDTDDYVTITIYDNGKGISKSDLPRVFSKTFTGNNGRTASSKSTGMGLYLCKELCKSLGHKIEIDSKVDKYTKVTITIYKKDFYNLTKK